MGSHSDSVTGDRKTTRSGRRTDRIAAAILRAALAPGDKITLDRRRDRCGTSVSPLRQATARLAATGLVPFAGRRGHRVAPVSAADLDEAMRLAAAFERLAGFCAVPDAVAERCRRLLPTAAEGDLAAEHGAIAEAAVARDAHAACGRPAAHPDRSRKAMLDRPAARTPEPTPEGPQR
jgi:DNA-binding GntR family transcriptional regulator